MKFVPDSGTGVVRTRRMAEEFTLVSPVASPKNVPAIALAELVKMTGPANMFVLEKICVTSTLEALVGKRSEDNGALRAAADNAYGVALIDCLGLSVV